MKRALVFSLASAGVAASACSQGGVTGAPVARAILDARLDEGPDDACALPGATRNVGSFGESGAAPAAVADGTASTGVVCGVRDAGGSTFRVHGEIYVDGARWFYVDGTVPRTYDKQANPEGVPANDLRVTLFGAGPAGSFSYAASGGCTVVYATDVEGPSAGRAWATVTCPRAERGEIGAGDPAETCTITAHFRFENCAL